MAVRQIACLVLVIACLPALAAAAFTDATFDAFGIQPADMPGWSSVYWPDYDGDGWPDLHLGGDALFVNNGDGSFTQISAIGLETEYDQAYRASWADADNDGDLDCVQSSDTPTSTDTIRKAYYFENGGSPNYLFTRHEYYACPLNTRTGNPLFFDGDANGFYEIYQATGGSASPNYGRASDRYFEANGGELWTDVSAAHFPELMSMQYERHTRAIAACSWGSEELFINIGIFVSVYGVDWADPSWNNILWWNDGMGGFDDVADEWGVAVEPHGEYGIGQSSGASWGDYDNDGDFDLVVANIQGWTALYRNNGFGGNFSNVTEEAGLYTATREDWHNTAWVDLENDGDLDLIVTAWNDQVSYLYENEGPENIGQFHLATSDFGFDPVGEFRGIDGGIGAADYDRDGDMDLFFEGGVDASEGKRLFRNDLEPADDANHWLVIQLQGNGTSCPLTAAGAQIRLQYQVGFSGIKQVENGHADASQHMHPVHFGLGDVDHVPWIEVSWPDRQREKWSWVDIGESVDQHVTLVQGSGSPVTSVADFQPHDSVFTIDGLYPNPARKDVVCQLYSRLGGTVRVALYDVTGRKVRELEPKIGSIGKQRLQISVADLPAGVYLLRATQDRRSDAAKLFIMR